MELKIPSTTHPSFIIHHRHHLMCMTHFLLATALLVGVLPFKASCWMPSKVSTRQYCSRLNHHHPSRNTFCKQCLLIGVAGILPKEPAYGKDIQQQEALTVKPYAPLSALLPATRIKLWIDKVDKTAEPLQAGDNSNPLLFQTMENLNALLQNPPELFVNEKPLTRTPLSSTAQLTTGISSANKVNSRQTRQGMNVGDRLAAVLNQADVER